MYERWMLQQWETPPHTRKSESEEGMSEERRHRETSEYCSIVVMALSVYSRGYTLPQYKYVLLKNVILRVYYYNQNTTITTGSTTVAELQ
jgi:hypothetical protein